MTNSNPVELFDEWAKRYDESIHSGGNFPFDGYDRVLDRITSAANAQPGMTVLDLGIGTGNLAMRFADAGCNVWGVDFSANMLAKAKEKLPDAVLLQADLLGEWPEELNRRFDRIVASYVFHEFPLPAKIQLLRKLLDHHLAADGHIVVGDIGFPTTEVREQAHEKWAHRWDEKEFYWAADETVALGEEFGVSITYEQVSSCGGMFVVPALKN